MLVIGRRKKSIVFANLLMGDPTVSGHLLTLRRVSLTNRNNNTIVLTNIFFWSNKTFPILIQLALQKNTALSNKD